MATFVLVHGAWHGSWSWKRVRKALAERGHEVFTPTLTGVGERIHLLTPQVNLETHINDVANLIQWEELDDIVLCGHSYGGCVAQGVADRFSDRIRALVYLDAFFLENGKSVMDSLPMEAKAAQIETAKLYGDGWKVPPIPAEFMSVNEKDRAWANRQYTMHPMATFEQPIQLTGAVDRIANVTYIVADGWGPSPFTPFYEKAKAKGWKTLAITCSHDVGLDKPDELVAALLGAAAS